MFKETERLSQKVIINFPPYNKRGIIFPLIKTFETHRSSLTLRRNPFLRQPRRHASWWLPNQRLCLRNLLLHVVHFFFSRFVLDSDFHTAYSFLRFESLIESLVSFFCAYRFLDYDLLSSKS